MSRILVASLFAFGLFVAGCKTDKVDRPHRGCHRIGIRRAGRNGAVHHHYAKPDVLVKEKTR